MFCQKCGTENKKTASFCSKCGDSINDTVAPAKKKRGLWITITIASLILFFCVAPIGYGYYKVKNFFATNTPTTSSPSRTPYSTIVPTSAIPTSTPTTKPTIVPTPTNVPSDIVVPDANSTNFSMTWIVEETFESSLDESVAPPTKPHELTITMGRTTTGSRGWFVTEVFSDGSGADNYRSLITFPHRGEENVVVTLAEYDFMVYRMKILRNGWLVFMAVDDDNIMREEVYRVPPINVTILD